MGGELGGTGGVTGVCWRQLGELGAHVGGTGRQQHELGGTGRHWEWAWAELGVSEGGDWGVLGDTGDTGSCFNGNWKC